MTTVSLSLSLSLILFLVHAAVVAINAALDSEDVGEVILKLKNPAAVMKDIDEVNAERYVTKLKNSKAAKCSLKQNTEDISKSDAYDFMLTQGEIQECISGINTEVEQEIAEAKCEFC